jgi:hypothetical protein
MAFLLLLSVSAEMATGIWSDAEVSVIVIEKEENSNAKEGEKEKGESKDKMFQQLSFQEKKDNNLSFFILSNIYIISSTYLAVPEIPPKQA